MDNKGNKVNFQIYNFKFNTTSPTDPLVHCSTNLAFGMGYLRNRKETKTSVSAEGVWLMSLLILFISFLHFMTPLLQGIQNPKLLYTMTKLDHPLTTVLIFLSPNPSPEVSIPTSPNTSPHNLDPTAVP